MVNESHPKSWSGPAVAGALTAAALGLAVYVVYRVDKAPRTDDAYAYADIINVAPEVSGRIVDLRVTDNQAVHQGDVLFCLDPRPYQEALAKAKASLATLDQEIVLTRRVVNAQKFAADAAASNVARARALASQATETRERMEPLLPEGFVAAEQLDQARTAERSAVVQLETAQLDARRAVGGLTGVDALVARREVLKAEIEMARLNLEYTTVKAPCDGRVVSLKTSAGQFAGAGHPVFTLVNTTHWYVVANFRETELAQIRPGSAAQVYLLSRPGQSYQGQVESVGYGVFPDDGGADVAGLPHVPRNINWVRVNQRFPVRILIARPDPSQFRLGASAVATITGPGARVQ
jgi:multidrug efflux system membrane fusion protein